MSNRQTTPRLRGRFGYLLPGSVPLGTYTVNPGQEFLATAGTSKAFMITGPTALETVAEDSIACDVWKAAPEAALDECAFPVSSDLPLLDFMPQQSVGGDISASIYLAEQSHVLPPPAEAEPVRLPLLPEPGSDPAREGFFVYTPTLPSPNLPAAHETFVAPALASFDQAVGSPSLPATYDAFAAPSPASPDGASLPVTYDAFAAPALASFDEAMRAPSLPKTHGDPESHALMALDEHAALAYLKLLDGSPHPNAQTNGPIPEHPVPRIILKPRKPGP